MTSLSPDEFAAMMRDGLMMVQALKEEVGQTLETPPHMIAEADQAKKQANDVLDELIKNSVEHLKTGCGETDCVGPPMMILLTSMLRNIPKDFLLVSFVALYRLAVLRKEELENAKSADQD